MENLTKNELINKIIDQWKSSVWQCPSTPKNKNERITRYNALAKMLLENNISTINFPFICIPKILDITVSNRNGTQKSQQMQGAAFWYLEESFLNNIKIQNEMASAEFNVESSTIFKIE